MSMIILGTHFNIGSREVYEDRVAAFHVTTPAGLNLSVALVADGVGGEEKGERASQVTLDTVRGYFQTSMDSSVPSLLTHAALLANQQVNETCLREGYSRIASTLAIAAIQDGKTLYVANVGDSRIYLVRDRRLSLLTMDHTFANVMVWQGRMSRDEADNDPRANAVSWALGVKEQIPVDLGLYVDTVDYEEANRRGPQGFPLQPGDAILVCSDGLIKRSPHTGELVTQPGEIASILSSETGDRAAQTLIALALSRGPDDNVSAAVLQVPRGRAARRRQPALLRGVALFALIVLVAILAFVALRLRGTSRQLSSIAATVTHIAASEMVATVTAQAVAAYTPTAIPPTPAPPTETALPTSAPIEIGVVFNGESRTPILSQQMMQFGDRPVAIIINPDDLADSNDGRVYVLAPSQLTFDSVTGTQASVMLAQGGSVLVQTGRYTDGVQVRLTPSDVVFSVQGSCLSVGVPDASSPTLIAVDCFGGRCGVIAQPGAGVTPIAAGHQISFDTATLTVVEDRAIPQADAVTQTSVLSGLGTEGRADIQTCLLRFLPAPATATPVEAPTTPAGSMTPGAIPEATTEAATPAP
jgi:serine/threonine protein phosphatase PrpC